MKVARTPTALEPTLQIYGELTVKVSPSLASGVNTSLEYLHEYPYDNAETIVSRFLPRLAPPLIVGDDEVDAFVQALPAVLDTALRPAESGASLRSGSPVRFDGP